MLSNFRQRFVDPPQEQQPLLSPTESQADPFDTDYPDQADDVATQRHWAVAMAETIYVASCTCPFCIMHPEIDDDADPGPTPSDAHGSLPSPRSIVQVLYPPSYLGTPRPFPDPPSYFLSEFPHPARGDDAEISPLMSSTTTDEGVPLSGSRPDPLAQDPSLTGVPSQGTPSSTVPSVEPNPSIIASGGGVFEDAEPLPAYSRFDQRRPRFPVASDVLGPYPPLPVFCQAAQ